MTEPFGIRSRELLTEVWRDVVSGASRFVPASLAFAALAVALVSADGATTGSALREAAEYRAAGAAIKTIVAPEAIDPGTCAALDEVGGVDHAGAIREAVRPLHPLALPDSTLPAYEVTPGFSMLLAAGGGGAGIVLSQDAADRLGVSAGDTLALESGSARVSGVYSWPDDGRRPGLGYAALVPVAGHGVFDECWLEAWPENDASTALLRETVIADRSDPTRPAEIGALNGTLGTRFRGGERFADRVTAFSPLAALVVSALIGALVVRSRRLELAAAQHFGLARADVAAIVLLESALSVLPAMICGGAALALWSRGAPGDAGALAPEMVRVLVGVGAGALLGTGIAVLRVGSGHLLRYFRDR